MTVIFTDLKTFYWKITTWLCILVEIPWELMEYHWWSCVQNGAEFYILLFLACMYCINTFSELHIYEPVPRFFKELDAGWKDIPQLCRKLNTNCTGEELNCRDPNTPGFSPCCIPQVRGGNTFSTFKVHCQLYFDCNDSLKSNESPNDKEVSPNSHNLNNLINLTWQWQYWMT